MKKNNFKKHRFADDASESKNKKCQCKSYNQPKDEQIDLEVILYNKEMTGKDSVCIDFCIVDDIKKLWNNNVPTLNCCCGHNIRNKSVIVDKMFAKKTKELLPYFDVFYWDIMEYHN